MTMTLPQSGRHGADATSQTPGAFGLAIDLRLPCPGLSSPTEVDANRRVRISRVDRCDIAEDLDRAGWVPMGEDRFDDGTVTCRLDSHPVSGFRFTGEGFGEHLVRPDGQTIESVVEDIDAYLLERFVIGKLMPLAAVLQGLEVFHASAVVVDDHVLACVGASGTGKSSVATRLILDGAGFFADDVLSVAIAGEQHVVYPGADILNVRAEEVNRLGGAERAQLGERLRSDEDRASFQVPRDGRRLPLGRIYVLDRSDAWDTLTFSPPPDFRHILACTYDIVTQAAPRLANLFELAYLLERHERVRVVRVPRHVDAARLAAALREDFDDR